MGFLTKTLEISVSSKPSKTKPKASSDLDHRNGQTGSGKNQTNHGRSACLSRGYHQPADVLSNQLLSLSLGFLIFK